MRQIRSMQIIQVDVTNVCDRACSNCTRFCGHYRPDRLYFMDPDYYEKAIMTLRDFDGVIGMIGGEPTLHPHFEELCGILKRHVPDREKRGLWSNMGGKYQQHYDLIQDTFGYFNLNDHSSNPITHTPILVASEDLMRDRRMTEQEWREYTDKCWVQMTWSATITPKGAYFCEVAGMLDYLFEGSIGWSIDENPLWTHKNISEYASQREWACRKCGCQVPLRPRRCTECIDDVTESNLERLRAIASPKITRGHYELFQAPLDPGQLRSCTWYWNKREMGFFEKLARRIRKKLFRRETC